MTASTPDDPRLDSKVIETDGQIAVTLPSSLGLGAAAPFLFYDLDLPLIRL